jgi:hypothetical protein
MSAHLFDVGLAPRLAEQLKNDDPQAATTLAETFRRLDGYFGNFTYSPVVEQGGTSPASYTVQIGEGFRVGTWVWLRVIVAFADTLSAGPLTVSLPREFPARIDATYPPPLGSFHWARSSTGLAYPGTAVTYFDDPWKFAGLGETALYQGSASPAFAAQGGTTIRATLQYQTTLEAL